MARVNYFALEEAIQTILRADPTLSGVSVEIEREIEFIDNAQSAVIIYLDGREAPEDMQRLAAGTRTDFHVMFTLWCMEFHLDSIAQAAKLRDDLIGKVEVALMKERTLNGNVQGSWLEGGEFLTADSGSGFLSAGEIKLVAKTHGTTA